jgi:hypothetical protein
MSAAIPMKRLLACGICLLALGLTIPFVWSHRPFDSAAWRSDPSNARTSVRYRMRNSLIARMRGEKWTRDRAIAELGLETNPAAPNLPSEGSTLGYELGKAWDGQGWIMEIHFNKFGSFYEAEVHPE